MKTFNRVLKQSLQPFSGDCSTRELSGGNAKIRKNDRMTVKTTFNTSINRYFRVVQLFRPYFKNYLILMPHEKSF